MNGQVEFTDGMSNLHALLLNAELDVGWKGQMLLAEPWKDVTFGAQGHIAIGGRRFQIVVNDFRNPWRAGKHQWIEFCDPVTAAEPFDAEAFHSNSQISYSDALCARGLALDGPAVLTTPQFDQVVIDGLTFPEALREICAREGADWHWHWHNAQICIGPLANVQANLLDDTSNEVDCPGGFELDLHLEIPELGSRVKVPEVDREGFVTSISIDLPDRPHAARICVLENPTLRRSRSTGSSSLYGPITSVEPLLIELPGVSSARLVRGDLYGLSTGHCQLGIPLAINDRVRVEWPRRALTTSLLTVHAESSVSVTTLALQFRADQFDVITREANFNEP